MDRKKKKFTEQVKRSLAPLNEASKEKDSAIKKILKRFQDDKISLERAEDLIKRVTEAFSEKKKSTYRPTYRPTNDSSSCSPPSRSC